MLGLLGLPFVTLFMVTVLMSITFQVLVFITATLTLSGFVLLIFSKVQKLKKGDLLSMGPASDLASKKYYLSSYFLLYLAFCAWMAIVLHKAFLLGVY